MESRRDMDGRTGSGVAVVEEAGQESKGRGADADVRGLAWHSDVSPERAPAGERWAWRAHMGAPRRGLTFPRSACGHRRSRGEWPR